MRFIRAAIDTPRPAIAITSHIYILLSSEVFAAPAGAALVPALVFTFTKANVLKWSVSNTSFPSATLYVHAISLSESTRNTLTASLSANANGISIVT